MKIGYPCLNRTLSCRSNHAFRLKNYSEERLVETCAKNLDCLSEIMKFNVERGFKFFRISSDIIPFASHPVCEFNWQEYFSRSLSEIGEIIKENDIRISMHPDQFTLLNSLDEDVYLRSVGELEYHVDLLDLMGLDSSAKVQIHVGGVYGDKEKSIERFIHRYTTLNAKIKKRLAIENDDRLYSLADCLKIHNETGTPIIFDVFHHNILNGGEDVLSAMKEAASTWRLADGILMVDYSSQQPAGRPGKHAETIDVEDFRSFLQNTSELDFDIMLEIKDKEASAAKAVKIASGII